MTKTNERLFLMQYHCGGQTIFGFTIISAQIGRDKQTVHGFAILYYNVIS